MNRLHPHGPIVQTIPIRPEFPKTDSRSPICVRDAPLSNPRQTNDPPQTEKAKEGQGDPQNWETLEE